LTPADVSGANKPARHAVSKPVGALHTSILVWATAVLLALHVGGAVMTQLSGASVFWRMLPFLRRPARA
jgi:hypothetical protein